MISGDASQKDRELAMDQFNNSAYAKVLFCSIRSCGKGISLISASRVCYFICSHEPICQLFGTEHCTTEDFKLGQVDIDDSRDELDPKAMRQDIKVLC